jgi:hypothetical protein
LKQIFPPHAKNRLEEMENKVKRINSYEKITNAFANWETIGVWNASDLLTFLLTSRMTMQLAESIERNDKKEMQDSIEYLLHFINYLLLTNIHPPSETHKDHIPFYPKDTTYPRTYEDAQDKMRNNLVKFFAQKIYSNPTYLGEFSQIAGVKLWSSEQLKNLLIEKFLPRVTPPLLIKNVGLAKELFLFYKLISENIGYVIPTLLYQRIFKGLSDILIKKQKRPILIRVPDFIIIKGGHIMGIELGRERGYFGTQKGALITAFSGASGIPTTQVNILVGNPLIDKWFDFGFKCNRCYRSFTLCDAFIEGETGKRPSFYTLSDDQLKCQDICDSEKIKSCKDSSIYTKIMNFQTRQKNLKCIHYNCLISDEASSNDPIIPFFSKVEGLEVIKEGLL